MDTTVHKIKVLLIEDNPGDIRLIQELLLSEYPGRFQIVSANTLNAAKEILDSATFDVILSDMHLPNSDGLTIVQQLQEAKPNLPIVILSSYESDELALKIVQAGAQDYLVKGQGDAHLINKSIRYAIERKRIERGLSFLAQYDSLTGLANRVLFRERLSHALTRAKRNQSRVALMFIDLDRFKNINDTLGHDAGDQLLVEVAGRLKSCMRDSDTIARLGGDEFTIILEDISHSDDATIVARKLIDILSQSVNLNGHDVFVTPSIGITIYPDDDEEEENLLKNADTAMYRAKEQGRNSYQFYRADMNHRSVERLKLESQLRHAISNEEFVLYYQPKIEIYSHKIVGAEALIRWQQPDIGMVSPGDFIPLAEETGIIVPMSEWIINTACKQIAEWNKYDLFHGKLAVNLSARQFVETDVVSIILNKVIETGISTEQFEVEITESMLMKDTELSKATLAELKRHGIHISLDDFGTGYSSLSYLKKFSIDTLKIDQSFVRDISFDSDDAAIASAIIALGNSLRLNVIAEGVETEEQLKFLHNQGCHQAQGFYFSRPLPAEEFTELLREQVAFNKQYKLRRSA